jgi:hypothetical protein
MVCWSAKRALQNYQEKAMNLEVTKAMSNARAAMTEAAFQQAASAASDAKNAVREASQEKMSLEMEEIIGKLQSDDPMTDQEVALIRAWVIGDAESYTRMENNLQDWLSEYDRLEKVLAGFERRECSAEDLLKLNGILEDATRISYDIANFLEKQDRINKFESAVADGLDDRERDLLARTLSHSLQSSCH